MRGASHLDAFSGYPLRTWLPSLSFVCEENLGSGILIDKTTVNPSLISSPVKDNLFFLLYSLEYLLITRLSACQVDKRLAY